MPTHPEEKTANQDAKNNYQIQKIYTSRNYLDLPYFQRFADRLSNIDSEENAYRKFGLAIPKAPVILPSFFHDPDKLAKEISAASEIDKFKYDFLIALKFPQLIIDFMPESLKNVCKKHGVSADKIEVFFVVQNMPWEIKTKLNYSPQTAFNCFLNPRKIWVTSGKSIQDLGSREKSCYIETVPKDDQVVFSLDAIELPEINDSRDEYCFYTLGISTEPSKAILTLHWLLSKYAYTEVEKILLKTASTQSWNPANMFYNQIKKDFSFKHFLELIKKDKELKLIFGKKKLNTFCNELSCIILATESAEKSFAIPLQNNYITSLSAQITRSDYLALYSLIANLPKNFSLQELKLIGFDASYGVELKELLMVISNHPNLRSLRWSFLDDNLIKIVKKFLLTNTNLQEIYLGEGAETDFCESLMLRNKILLECKIAEANIFQTLVMCLPVELNKVIAEYFFEYSLLRNILNKEVMEEILMGFSKFKNSNYPFDLGFILQKTLADINQLPIIKNESAAELILYKSNPNIHSLAELRFSSQHQFFKLSETKSQENYFVKFLSLPGQQQEELVSPFAEGLQSDIIIRSTLQLLESFKIPTEKILGLQIGIDEDHTFADQLKEKLQDNKEQFNVANSLFFVLQTLNSTHAVAVVINKANKIIYCVDPKTNAQGTEAEAMNFLIEATEDWANPFYGFKVVTPPAKLKRQQTDNIYCGVYVVWIFLGIFLNEANIKPNSHYLNAVDVGTGKGLVTKSPYELRVWLGAICLAYEDSNKKAVENSHIAPIPTQ